MNICPCLSKFLNKFKTKQTKASYEGQRQYEEEQFMNPQHEEISLSDTISPQQKVQASRKTSPQVAESKPAKKVESLLPEYYQEKQPETEILNIKMEMPNTQPIIVTPAVEQKAEQSIEQLIEAELLIDPSDYAKQEVIENQQNKQQSQQHQQQIEQINFTVNLDPLDPHYALIHEKVALVPQLLKSQGQRLQVGSPNKIGLEIFLVDNPRVSSFLLKYTLNCSYSFYLSVLRGGKALLSMGGLAQSKTLESYRPNLTLNTLKFKRLGVLQPRDCFYVKYQNGGKRHHWQLYLNDESTPQSAQFKTCQIFCCKSFKQQSDNLLRVTEYVEVDLGASNLNSVIPKLTVETRNFLQNLNEYLQRNCEQQLA